VFSGFPFSQERESGILFFSFGLQRNTKLKKKGKEKDQTKNTKEKGKKRRELSQISMVELFLFLL
jgi:hypothetical protein